MMASNHTSTAQFKEYHSNAEIIQRVKTSDGSACKNRNLMEHKRIGNRHQ